MVLPCSRTMFGRGGRSFLPSTVLASQAAGTCKGVRKLIYRPRLCVSREETSAVLLGSGADDVSFVLPLRRHFHMLKRHEDGGLGVRLGVNSFECKRV